MGSKIITISGDDIIVDNVVYDGSPGLWSLITEKGKNELSPYIKDNEDFEHYIQLLKQTNVLYHDFNPESTHPRSNSSWKWKQLLAPIWQAWRRDEDSGSDYYETSGSGLRAYIQKDGKCYKVQSVDGDGVLLSPRPQVKRGDGLFLRRGRRGEGLILGPNSPFKKIPVLGWLL